MAYSKTNWKDRVVEKPLTFTVQNNPDGTITLIPAEGQIIEGGTPLTALIMNNLEKQYDEAVAWVKKYGIGGNAGEIPGNDANNITESGNYIAALTANTPSDFGSIIHIARNNDAGQIFIPTAGLYTMLVRRRNGPTWSGWRELITDIAPTWTNLPLQNGATSNAGYPIQYTKIGNEVRLRGMLNGNVPAGTIFGTLPAGYRPGAPYMYLTTHDGTIALTAKIHVAASGVMTLLSKTGDTHVTYVNTDFIT
ncbi:pyocin knob domain-containing protein [Bacillus sp. B-jedd]|uniref:pyocin knob domain-containing protein n=1 Tax=Bacillus sp. B-jedd TaxID=1476857 RepID=UPI0005155FC6|nr:pyocin knob domain-containing protein [Bacillus sp. B-jedd]CEG26017.1 SPBc2 prophage-derived protein YomR [Bacillus sp. B-jedd]